MNAFAILGRSQFEHAGTIIGLARRWLGWWFCHGTARFNIFEEGIDFNFVDYASENKSHWLELTCDIKTPRVIEVTGTKVLGVFLTRTDEANLRIMLEFLGNTHH